MNIDNLPGGFRREETCFLCEGKSTLFEAFLDERGVITRFRCNECGHVSGLIYDGRFIETFKKAEEAELKGEPVAKEVRQTEDDLCLNR